MENVKLKILEEVCEKKTFNGLTVNMLDKCRQGLNLSTKRSNALCGTIFNYSPLSTSAWLLRSKSTAFAWSSSRAFGNQMKKKTQKICGGDQPPLASLCTITSKLLQRPVLRGEHGQVKKYFRNAVERLSSQEFRTIPRRCRSEFVRMSTKSSGGGHRGRGPALKDSEWYYYDKQTICP